MGVEDNMRGRSRGNTFLIVLVIVLAITAVVLGVFRIRTVNVIGCGRHSSEEIKEDLIYNFPTKNTLYLAWKYRHAMYEERTPYLNTVQVKIETPGTVRIIVQEKKLTGYVQYNGQNVYFDENGTVLDITEKIYDGAALVEGIEMEEPVLYQKLPMTNTALLHTMLSIAQLIKESDLPASIINFDENLNITITIGTVRVEIGQAEYLEEKISNLVTIYPKVQGQTGVLNMAAFTGKNETITFGAGEEETEAVTEEEVTDEDQFSDVDTSGSSDDGLLVGQVPDGASQGEVQDQGDAQAQEEEAAEETTGVSAFMVFDSSGTLRYDAHVVGGQVVDAYGNPIDGCSVNEKGNVVDAYWNEIDPATGTLAE